MKDNNEDIINLLINIFSNDIDKKPKDNIQIVYHNFAVQKLMNIMIKLYLYYQKEFILIMKILLKKAFQKLTFFFFY